MANRYVEQFIPLVDALAMTFGKNCEVVLHDFAKPHQSIIKIANSHITGRKIGDPATDLLLSYLSKKPQNRFLAGYRTKNDKGAEIRSTSIFIRNSKQKIVGALCINIDITPYLSMINLYEQLCNTIDLGIDEQEQTPAEKFEPNVDNLINDLLNDSIDNIGKQVVHMSKEDKLHIIADLKNKGLFLIKGSAKKTAKRLNVSLTTIYKYIEEIR
jgi:predicted transcriptional regulator YheO